MNIYDRIINMLLEARIEDYLDRLDEVGEVKRRNKEIKRKRESDEALKMIGGITKEPEGLDFGKLNKRTEKAQLMAKVSPHTQPKIQAPVKGKPRLTKNAQTAHSFMRARNREIMQQTAELQKKKQD